MVHWVRDIPSPCSFGTCGAGCGGRQYPSAEFWTQIAFPSWETPKHLFPISERRSPPGKNSPTEICFTFSHSDSCDPILRFTFFSSVFQTNSFDALHTTNFHLFPNFLPLLINLRIRIFRLLQQFALINAYKLVAFMYSANVTLEIHRVTTCQNYFNAIFIYFFRFSRTNLLHSLVISLISKNLEKTVPTFRYLTLGLFRLTTRWNF